MLDTEEIEVYVTILILEQLTLGKKTGRKKSAMIPHAQSPLRGKFGPIQWEREVILRVRGEVRKNCRGEVIFEVP